MEIRSENLSFILIDKVHGRHLLYFSFSPLLYFARIHFYIFLRHATLRSIIAIRLYLDINFQFLLFFSLSLAVCTAHTIEWHGVACRCGAVAFHRIPFI